MAEDLTEYYREIGIKVRYLHSDVDTLERLQIIRGLRLGELDVLVGINLLREGLDIPEVSLVGILDADKEGFLRSERSLIQTIGRAARHERGKVLLYADKETDSIQKAVQVTRDRRKLQAAYNTEHGITPKSASRGIRDMQIAEPLPKKGKKGGALGAIELRDVNDLGSLRTVIDKLRGEMKPPHRILNTKPQQRCAIRDSQA